MFYNANQIRLTFLYQSGMINTAKVRIYSGFGWFNNIVFGQQGENSVIGWQLHSITIQVSSVRFWTDFFVYCRFSAEGRRNGKKKNCRGGYSH